MFYAGTGLGLPSVSSGSDPSVNLSEYSLPKTYSTELQGMCRATEHVYAGWRLVEC